MPHRRDDDGMTTPPTSERDPLVERIDELLPQTQCGKCGHPGCYPYARAVAAGDAHNQCPPGGQSTADALAGLLERPLLRLDHRGYPDAAVNKVAYIREDECIGCTKCIQACPVDAIVGAARYMHTVIADECTGCDLCVEPCPVDCIDMLVAPPLANEAGKARADRARARYEARQARLRHERAERARRRRERLAAQRDEVAGAAITKADEGQRQKRLLKLKTAYNMAHKHYKQAHAALERAQRQDSGDLETMRARVNTMRARAEEARRRLNAFGRSE